MKKILKPTAVSPSLTVDVASYCRGASEAWISWNEGPC